MRREKTDLYGGARPDYVPEPSLLTASYAHFTTAE